MVKMKSYKLRVISYKLQVLKILLCLGFLFTYDLRLKTYDLFAQDKIVAIVNSSVITQKDLNDFVNFMRIQLSANLKGEQLESKIQSMKLDLLDKLIDDQLILQEAKMQKLKIDESRVKAKIEQIKSGYDSDAEFQRELAKQGLVQADIEVKIREQLLMYNIVEAKIRRKIAVNPAEVTEFYNKNIEQFNLPEQREFESLALKDETLAQEISDGLREGLQLGDLAKKYSLELNGYSVTRTGELRKDIEEIIFKLKVYEARGPVKIDAEYYFFRLNDIKPPRQQKLSEAQERIYNFLFEGKMEQELSLWLEELRNKSFVKIMHD